VRAIHTFAGVDYAVIGCRCLLGLVFAVAVVGKLRDRAAVRELAGSVAAMRLLPDRWAVPAAGAIAGAEALVVVLLVISPVAGCWLAALLLATFAAAIATGRRRGARARCRCFGSSGRAGAVLGARHGARNAGLALAAVFGAAAGSASVGAAVPTEGLHPGGVAVAVAAGAVLAIVAITLDDLVALFAP